MRIGPDQSLVDRVGEGLDGGGIFFDVARRRHEGGIRHRPGQRADRGDAISPVLRHRLHHHRLERLREVRARLEIRRDDIRRDRDVADGHILIGIEPRLLDEVDEHECRRRALPGGDDRLALQVGDGEIGHRGLGEDKSPVAVREQRKIDEPAIRAGLLRQSGSFGPHERDIGVAAHHFRDRRLHAPGGLGAHDLKAFLLERAAPQRDILRRIEQAAQHLVELDLLRCRWLRRQEPCERGGEHGEPTKAARPTHRAHLSAPHLGPALAASIKHHWIHEDGRDA